MRGFLLFLAAVLLSILFLPVGGVYSLLRLWSKAGFKIWVKRVSQYFLLIAISIDQLGNVIMQELFNDVLIQKDGIRFGDEDETISSVLGKNQQANTLSRAGKVLNGVLHLLDTNHSIKAIEADENLG